MDKMDISHDGPGSGFRIEGYPDAVKVIALSGADAANLSDLALHLRDLEYCLACLEQLAIGASEPVQSALWEGAIVTFMKCFQRSNRTALQRDTIYTNNEIALECFDQIRLIRNKHLVHDENSLAQACPGAIMNAAGTAHKIAKIITLSVRVSTINQTNYSNMRLLVESARDWTSHQYEDLCNKITTELEAISHDDLLARPNLAYNKPGIGELGIARKKP
jgi:hypothetical protein